MLSEHEVRDLFDLKDCAVTRPEAISARISEADGVKMKFTATFKATPCESSPVSGPPLSGEEASCVRQGWELTVFLKVRNPLRRFAFSFTSWAKKSDRWPKTSIARLCKRARFSCAWIPRS